MNPFGHSLKEKNMKTLEIEKYLTQGETLVLTGGKWLLFIPDQEDERCVHFNSAQEVLDYIKGA